MELLSFDRLLGIFGALVAIAGIGFGLAMDTRNRAEVRAAIACFSVAALGFLCTIGVWTTTTELDVTKRIIVTALLCAVLGVLLLESIRWSIARHEAKHAPKTAREAATVETPPVSSQPAQAEAARKAPPHIPPPVLPSVKKKDKFAIVIPFNPANKNVPIPINTASNDPNEGFFRGLMDLADRPEKQADGTPWPVERDFTSENSRGIFIGRLLQYYIFRSIDELERDSEGIEWTREGGSRPLVRVGIAPPDRTPYSIQLLFAELSNSPFFGARDRMIWKVRSVDLPVHAHFSFLEHPSSPKTGVAQYVVRLERPGYFLIDLVVTQTIGPIEIAGVTGASLPKGFQPGPRDLPTTAGYPFIITMTYEIHRTSDMEFSTEDYVKWADGLFGALKQRMAFDSR